VSDSQIGSGWNNACSVIHPYLGGRLSIHDPSIQKVVGHAVLSGKTRPSLLSLAKKRDH
jgi:hypothetical protein